jgi:hypothetical protein
VSQDDGAGQRGYENSEKTVHEKTEDDEKAKEVNCRGCRQTFNQEFLAIMRVLLELALFSTNPGDPRPVKEADNRRNETEHPAQRIKHFGLRKRMDSIEVIRIKNIKLFL